MSYRDEILNLPQFYATTAHPLSNGTSTISASERHVLIARFLGVSQELALNIAARADAEIAELRRDAERYRFLRSCNIDMRNRLEHYADSALDTAIDAARGGE